MALPLGDSDYAALIELVRDAQAGDREAFAELFTHYSSGLGNYLVSLVNNIEDRDELAQEIFLKVWLRLHQLRQPSSFKPWLYRIATNVVSDFRRRKRLSCDTLEDKNEIEDVEKFEEQIAEEELVKLALKKVPWKYRVCLLYNYRGTALPK